MDMDDAPQLTVDRDDLPFIAENLLSYVVIFQQLLPRFSRVDLVSPKISLMLYRLTKVCKNIEIMKNFNKTAPLGFRSTEPTELPARGGTVRGKQPLAHPQIQRPLGE